MFNRMLARLRQWAAPQQAGDGWTVQWSDSGQQFLVSSDETILQAALRQGIDWPYQCRVGGCASCKCQLLQGKVRQLTESAYVLSAEELDQHYVLACQSVPKSPLVVRLPADVRCPPPSAMTAEVLSVRPLTADIVSVRLRCRQPLFFRAGQYAELCLLGLPKRPYSFSQACPVGGCYEPEFFIRIEPEGLVSRALARAVPGQPLTLTGPFGSFQLVQASTETPLLLVAGGSGLAPLLSLLQQARSEHCQRPVTLFFAARSAADLYVGAFLEELQTQWPGSFTLIPVLSREPANSAWTGVRGDLCVVISDWLAAEPTRLSAQLYVCGSPSLVDAVLRQARCSGMEASQLFADSFVPQSVLERAE